jgi:hypothetical protein
MNMKRKIYAKRRSFLWYFVDQFLMGLAVLSTPLLLSPSQRDLNTVVIIALVCLPAAFMTALFKSFTQP